MKLTAAYWSPTDFVLIKCCLIGHIHLETPFHKISPFHSLCDSFILQSFSRGTEITRVSLIKINLVFILSSAVFSYGRVQGEDSFWSLAWLWEAGIKMSGDYEHLKSVSLVYVFKAVVLYNGLKCSLYLTVRNGCYWQLSGLYYIQKTL